MKLTLLILALLSSAVIAAEPSREWTDAKGRKITGTLVDKAETTAEVLLKSGKRVTLKLADLSKADQDYVAAANVLPSAQMTARTVKVDSNEAGTKSDRRAVEVTVSRVRGRSYSLEIVWLGPKGNTVGVYKRDSQDIDADGVIEFSVDYKSAQNGVGADYKGYAVALVEDGEFGERIIARASSQKPFERFLEADPDEE